MLFLGLKSWRYLFYSAYLGTFLLMNMAYTGHGYQWFWPRWPTVQYWSNPVLILSFGLAGLIFALRFLELYRSFPRLHRAVLLLCVLFAFLGLLAVALQERSVALVVSFVSVLLLSVLMPLLVGISFFSGNRSAKYFLLGSLTHATGASITALTVWGFFPYTPYLYHAVEVGMFIDAVLMALALADQYRLLQEERKRVFDLVKDFGTSESPKSTRSSTTHWCPGRPGHPAFRHNIASSLRLHTGLPYDWTPRSDAPLGSPLAPSARRVSRVASQLPGTTRLRFALHGGQRLSAVRLARLDPLTGLNNRRAFYEIVTPLWNKGIRKGYEMAVMILDLDRFKQLNDTYGHQCGDEALKQVARLLTDNVREGDVVARWGGEEFIVFLDETGQKEATQIASRIRRAIEEWPFKMKEGASFHFTASAGVTCSGPGETDLEKLINATDRCLYSAKEQGRNRVLVGDSSCCPA